MSRQLGVGVLDTVQDKKKVTLDISQAADLLGVTPDAVRKRIQRGTLKAEKIDGQWYIEQDEIAATVEEDVLDESGTEQDNVQDTDKTEQDKPVKELYERLLQEKDSELSRLREDIQWLREEVERKDQLIYNSQANLQKLLPDPNAEEDEKKASWFQRVFKRN